jgi:hypothetical protein
MDRAPRSLKTRFTSFENLARPSPVRLYFILTLKVRPQLGEVQVRVTMITNAQLFRTDPGTEGQLSQPEQQWCLQRVEWLLQLNSEHRARPFPF